MKIRVALCCLVVMSLALALGAARNGADRAELAVLNEANWDDFAPEGKEVDAIYGDAVLRNRHLVAVIAQPLATRHANMTVRDVAGALIDLADRESQSDQLSAFYPGRRRFPFRSWSAAGADGGPLDLEVESTYSGESASLTVRAAPGPDRPEVEVTYRLDADAKFLTMITRFTNTGDEPLTVPLEDDLRADSAREDMTKSPNGESGLFWVHDRFWGQAYGIETPGRRIQSNSTDRTSVLRYLHETEGDGVTLAPGESHELVRRVYAGANLLDVKAAVAETRGESVHPLTIVLQDRAGRPVPGALVEASRSGSVRGEGRTDAQGRLATGLPAGSYRLRASAMGVTVLPGVEITVADRAGQEFTLRSGDYHPGQVTAAITDETGGPIPCKVAFLPRDGTPRPDLGPESAEFGVGNLRYAPLGQFVQALPAGHYDVIVSRGPEYDAIFTELLVPPGEEVALEGTLVRSVETPGWISSDFHSHSSPSGDNTGSQLGRVLNLVCEHIEFAPCTEHNRIDTYQPHIDRLQIGAFLATVSGIELTGQPLPLNHQNAFPLVMKPRTQDGGGPQTDTDVERQIERLALWDDRSEKLIQQNHPDIGWLFYDRDGDGVPDAGFGRAIPHIDVIEIHPIESALTLEPVVTYGERRFNNRVFNWLQLLNQGYRIPGVVNTDAHYNFHGSGWLRNWIRSPTDEPAEIDPLDVVRAAEAGNVIMSNGPYLEAWLRAPGGERVTAGEDLDAPGGRIELGVRVQCANWLDVDRVFVLVNGRVHPSHDYTRADHPDRFRDGTVKFDQTLELTLDGDAHVVVVAGGENLRLGPVMGPAAGGRPPVALSNPIFVDVDGGGFRPNGDTLGHPLPVRLQ